MREELRLFACEGSDMRYVDIYMFTMNSITQRTYEGHLEDMWRTRGGHMEDICMAYGGHVEDM